MKRRIIVISTIIILTLIIILIDANLTKKMPITNDTLSYSSPIIKSIRTNACYSHQTQISFILFKKEEKLEIWSHSDTCHQLIRNYNVQLNNQLFGPRLYDDELIIPEGIYNFRPLSDSFSLTINFPNKYDISKTNADNRPNQSSIISFKSTIENNTISLKKNDLKELYECLEQSDLENIYLIIVPSDIRKTGAFPNCNNCPHWVFELYGQLKLNLLSFQD